MGYSSHDIIRFSAICAHDIQPYEAFTNTPKSHGVLDTCLGISKRSGICRTCGLKLNECMGHFGYISLEMPVFHMGYFKTVIKILKCICKSCGNILMSNDDCNTHLRRFHQTDLSISFLNKLVEQVTKKCPINIKCFHCHKINGFVNKCYSS